MIMNKELCFILNDHKLYLEQTLVDYDTIPILFLCRSDDEYYIALCTNLEEYEYIVCNISIFDVHELLNGNIYMDEVFKIPECCWKVISGEDIDSDQIVIMNTLDLKDSMLPEKKSYFEALTKDVKEYIKTFNEDFNSRFLKDLISDSDLEKISLNIKKKSLYKLPSNAYQGKLQNCVNENNFNVLKGLRLGLSLGSKDSFKMAA